MKKIIYEQDNKFKKKDLQVQWIFLKFQHKAEVKIHNHNVL